MLKNYLKIAFRNLWRSKVYSVINVTGLAVGMACCLLILLFVQDELSYDRFHAKADRIYQITYQFETTKIARVPPPMAPLLKANFPEIAEVARLYNRSASLEVTNGGSKEQYEEQNFYFADSTVTNIFSFDFLEGDSQTALREPFAVIITEPMARKYFKDVSPLGKTLLFAGRFPFKVSGVVKAFPPQSHLHFDFMASYESMFAVENEAARENLPRNWVISHSFTYVLLHPGKSPTSINAKFPAFLAKHGDENLHKKQKFTLTPLIDLHLNSDLQAQTEPGASRTYVYIFSGIALITLLIACINFINLSTARSLKRAREVGMRKMLGAEKRQLVGQFLGESLVVSFVAMLLSLGLMAAFMPSVNELTQKNFSMTSLNSPSLLIGLIGVFLLSGLVAGMYPAFFVTNFQPAATLKGNAAGSLSRGLLLRKALVVVQFTVTIALITGALIAWNQWSFLRNQPLGFQKEQIINIPLFSNNLNSIFGGIDGQMRAKTNAFEDALLTNPTIQATTLSSGQLGGGAVRRGIIPEGFTREDNLFIAGLAVDYDFIKTYNLKLLAGRDFSKTYGTDHLEAFILNEKAVKQFNWKSPADAIGKQIEREGKKGRVVGVVQDFHYLPLQFPIEAFLLDVETPVFTQFSVRISAQNVPQTIAFIQDKWKEFFPEKVFTYSFLDQDLERQYQSQERLGGLVRNFAGLAVLISCLGLYGLILLTTQQKVKEIGIRKVLGASVSSIVGLLSKEFVRLVLLAFVIAIPIAWYAMHQWLQDFAYKIDIQWWVFGVAGILAVAVAFLTISFQSIKAALANPVKSLRSE